MPAAIHQLVAGFSNGDAISNEARLLRALFRELDEHEGVEEILEFKHTILRAPEAG